MGLLHRGTARNRHRWCSGVLDIDFNIHMGHYAADGERSKCKVNMKDSSDLQTVNHRTSPQAHRNRHFVCFTLIHVPPAAASIQGRASWAMHSRLPDP